MRNLLISVIAFIFLNACLQTAALAGPCLEVTLTGTMGGTPSYGGLAGAGTLVKFGDSSNDCGDIRLQFDAGRGTNVRLSELGISPHMIDAFFFTHVHSDHVDGLADILQQRWHFLGGPVDVICSEDVKAAKPPPERTMSCRNLLENIAQPYIQSGEIAQRYAENHKRKENGPSELVNFKPVPLPLPQTGVVVWRSGELSVSAIGSRHIAGHLSYRVDTPAGSVVIGGDAGNDLPAPPRPSSTSARVELLAQGADVIVHSTIHPVMGPDFDSGFPGPVFYRQSTAQDLGAMAQKTGASHLMLTHLIPPVGAVRHGPFLIPGGPLKTEDYVKSVRDGGFKGKVYVGTDLLTLRLPQR